MPVTSADSAPTTSDRLVPWILRGLWVLVLLSGGRALDAALAAVDSGANDAVRWIGLVVWVAGVAAMAVPAVTTLTATRLVVPVSIGVALVTWLGGAATVDAVTFLGAAVVSTVVALSSGLGRAFVQASAYGNEDRHLLRAPLAYAAVAVAAWVVWLLIGLVAGLTTARANWLPATVLWVVVAAGAVVGFPRWHRLSTRWLVLVPAGVVVHDHLVLAETLMLRRQEIAAIGLAPADTDAADLTGPAPGHAVEIRTTEPVTAIVSATTGKPAGTAIHLTGCLVAPSRPGKALVAAQSRRLPVGAL